MTILRNIPRSATRIAALVLAAAAILTVSACAHKDLTAPCVAQTGWGSALAADEDGCGLMRNVN